MLKINKLIRTVFHPSKNEKLQIVVLTINLKKKSGPSTGKRIIQTSQGKNFKTNYSHAAITLTASKNPASLKREKSKTIIPGVAAFTQTT